MELKIKTIQNIFNEEWFKKDKNKRYVDVDSLINYILKLSNFPHYNTENTVQQFMLDIKKKLER